MILEIILAILSAFCILILLSLKSEKPKNPLIDLKNELDKTALPDSDKNACIDEFKNTFSYQCYELKEAYYELGQALKKILKK